jgi:hypothetical protein
MDQPKLRSASPDGHIEGVDDQLGPSRKIIGADRSPERRSGGLLEDFSWSNTRTRRRS